MHTCLGSLAWWMDKAISSFTHLSTNCSSFSGRNFCSQKNAGKYYSSTFWLKYSWHMYVEYINTEVSSVITITINVSILFTVYNSETWTLKTAQHHWRSLRCRVCERLREWQEGITSETKISSTDWSWAKISTVVFSNDDFDTLATWAEWDKIAIQSCCTTQRLGH